ncbi:DNA repair protein XRCC2 [Toxotes jaculatrix]|uniref:DNA repair protein XRCC2 n=1 Tax=Toxotes jaculatrix TaxID=941984 RepID=UPI001B3A9F05|nr:DNA repair protein XRCC2 [Toxotes jaculatrix]
MNVTQCEVTGFTARSRSELMSPCWTAEFGLGAGSEFRRRRRSSGGEDEVRAEMSESGAQLFARLEARRCLKDIEPRLFPEDGGPNYGEVVELYGTEGTGKTELLYHLLCRCVLPKAAGGLEVDVVFVDTDYSLDMLRLVSIVDSRLNAALSTSSPSAGSDEAALRSCLSRLLVVHCSSSSQLLLTLHFLETSFSSRPGLALLLVDSISAFYWLDRSEGGASLAKQEEKLSKCSDLLGRLLRDYRITVFATCHAIRRSHSGSSSSSEPDRPYLCRSWQRLVTHRLLCSRQEAANSMASAAGGSKEQRMQQVFSVHCTSSSSSSGTKAYRSSSFYVTEGGVEFFSSSFHQ